jgi:hypothetical protein
MSSPVNGLRPIRRRIRHSGLPRTFNAYEIKDPASLTIPGAAPKVIIHRLNAPPEDFFLAKGAEKWGEIETYSEYFFNQLGRALGLDIAHSGLIRMGGQLRFTSKSFLLPNEILTHGYVIAQDSLGKEDVQRIGRKEEQRVYDIEIVREMLGSFCGDSFPNIFSKFLEMLVFDALLGATDRHIQNWGVIVSVERPRSFRLAPIFDTARAFFWDFDEARLKDFHFAPATENRYEGYLNRARPCIGLPGLRGKRVNHFGLVEYLIKHYPIETKGAFSRLRLLRSRRMHCPERGMISVPQPCIIAKQVLKQYPFSRVYTPLRKLMILRILEMRTNGLRELMTKRGCHV